MSNSRAHPGPGAEHQLAGLVTVVRAAVAAPAGGPCFELAAEQLRGRLPGPDILTAEQRMGSADGYRNHILHVEADGSFSVVAAVWRPGQSTRIHDHLTWCVVGVIQGTEHEELFGEDLSLLGTNDNQVGDISAFAPPGDIHRVRNVANATAISIHIYGTDITRSGSSIRRCYD